MSNHEYLAPTSLALFTLAEIKAATAAFDSGDINLFDALNAIIVALDDFRAASFDRGRREAA
jgi:hypothetical protein